MGLYLLTLPTTMQHTLKHGVNRMVVAAESAADARLAAAAEYTGDTPWSEATAVELVDTTTINSAAALDGWRFKLTVAPIGTYGSVDFEVTGGPGTTANDTITKVGASLVTALNAHTGIAGASYVATTGVFTIASAGDALGASTVLLKVLAPIETGPGGQTSGDDNIASAFLATAITHEGTAGDELALSFNVPTYVLPKVLATGRT